ncbi:hypothetical protein [Terrimonas ferruginea]|uniref:hypothetical protein n=1 Tax=Terrimonas ferruginea TaxID=249 RepID=UPI00040E40D2|nr:hypothetical protein [Terrimonas ferruginea]
MKEELAKTEGGREFLAIWEKVYIIGGIVTAGPLVITGLIDGRVSEGISESEIEQFEKEGGKKIPLEHAVAGEDWKQLQQGAKAHLAKTELEVSADYWAFCSLYGGEQFFFFYFGGGDDPVTYIFEGDRYSTPEIKSEKQTFSQFVEWYIDYRQTNGY